MICGKRADERPAAAHQPAPATQSQQEHCLNCLRRIMIIISEHWTSSKPPVVCSSSSGGGGFSPVSLKISFILAIIENPPHYCGSPHSLVIVTSLARAAAGKAFVPRRASSRLGERQDGGRHNQLESLDGEAATTRLRNGKLPGKGFGRLERTFLRRVASFPSPFVRSSSIINFDRPLRKLSIVDLLWFKRRRRRHELVRSRSFLAGDIIA